MRRAHGILAVLLTAIVLLAPLPVGSNRAAAWMLWAMILFGAGGIALIAMTWLSGDKPLRMWRFLPLVTPVLVVLGWGLFQILPIAAYLPGFLQAQPLRGVLDPATLSLAPRSTLIALLRIFSSVVFFMLMLEVSGRLERARAIGWALYFGVVIHALWGIVALKFMGDTYFWGTKSAYIGSATGTFINRNSYATFLGMGAVLGMALIMELARRPRMRHPDGVRLTSPESLTLATLWVSLALVLITVFSTQSRMGLAVCMLGMFLVWFLSPRAESLPQAASRPKRRKPLAGNGLRRLGIGAGIVALFIIALFTIGEATLNRALFVEAAAEYRLSLYAQVLQMIAQRPLTGFGLDAFPAAYELYHQAPVSSAVFWDYTHSSYLMLWVELGLVFGTLPMIAGARILWRLARLLRRRKHDVALPIAAFAGFVLAALHSLVDFSLEMQANIFLLLAMLALGISRRDVPQRRINSEDAAGDDTAQRGLSLPGGRTE
ncbi:O-antigen ligase family protein [Phaeovulum sp. W22_SRMD_FR3]|uniref:O-antigen ligase family protein n=1 Tax=Phaeovulum sp. W22_SRMD_FR3 TaxID=3240274 RepID=UPI003F98F693